MLQCELNFTQDLFCYQTFSQCYLNAYLSLRAQTVHWIGAQICVCMFLDTGVQPVFRQPHIHTRQYLDKYCMNQSESRKDINNPK